MKAIVTTYKGPTNCRGARIIADDGDGNRLTIPFDHALNTEGVHRKAAQGLCDKMGWKGRIIGGGLKRGMAWVFAE
jgi:hypothetical protein